MTKFIALLSLVFTVSCSHTIDFRSNRFAIPHVSVKEFGGSIAGSFARPIEVELVSSLGSNPPTRSGVIIKDQTSSFLTLFTNHLSVDLDMGLFGSGVEIFSMGSETGLRWQFLGYGTDTDIWVGSVQAGLGQFTSTSNNNGGAADSKVKSESVGVSVGYKRADVIIYGSHIRETHKVDTTVSNTNGSFGPYNDKGTHGHTAIGISSYADGFRYAFEYSLAAIEWNTTDTDSQGNFGVLLGYSW